MFSLRPSTRSLLRRVCTPATATATTTTTTRQLHNRIPTPPIPKPTPFVPDAATFLTLIGRRLSQHASKIPTWEALFSLTSPQLRDLGVEPTRARRYLLAWREKFRRGQYGVGGDATCVVDGAAPVRVVEVPAGEGVPGTATLTPGMVKRVVNAPPGVDVKPGEARGLKGVKFEGAHTVVGPHVRPVKGTGGRLAEIRVAEGLWEDRRGHKIDGGERRQAEVRSKRRAEEKK